VSDSVLTAQLDADTVADRRSRLKRGLAQRPYFLENTRIQ